MNHRSTFTGITVRDRVTTITAIADEVKRFTNGGGHNFSAQFRSPGHVALLRATGGLLSRRRGQTELSIALAVMAGITPAITICEMFDDETGLALGKEDAREYGRRQGLVFVEGSEVEKAWGSFEKAGCI